jgi:two-component system OmpR family response regulator
VDVQVSRLRQRLGEDAREPSIIKTVRGEGYVLAATVTPVPVRALDSKEEAGARDGHGRRV